VKGEDPLSGRAASERVSLAKCANRTVCFHVIYQETQFYGCSPRDRVNHVNIFVIFRLCYAIFYLLYCYALLLFLLKTMRYI
jgi:hypothetical protein